VLRQGQLFWAIALALALLAPQATASQPFQPGAVGYAHRPVCKAVPKRVARCHAEVIVADSGAPLVTFTPSGYGPSDLQSAYGLTAMASSEGATQTIAIVDAYDAPSAEADLGIYRSQFGLPACTTANGCFRKVNQRGGTTPPSTDAGWAQEISLDLDMASAICPNCHILLVEADSANFSDLSTAVNEAAALGATQISNSYGGSEFNGETTLESAYNHPGIAVTVSSGDAGYGVEFPASSRYVTAVGGTHLVRNTSTRGWAESAWSGAGSGCSAYVPKPAWQTDSGCSMRSVADVSAVADPNTGVAVYDSLAYKGSSGWMVFGGTSASSPIVAAYDALIGAPAASLSYPYGNTALFNDVTSGSNGSCGGGYLCTGTAGYDGPTGLGTPNGGVPTGSKPAVATQAASPFAATTATLNATVRAYGTDTTYHFDYGTTSSYGSRSPGVDADAGSGLTSVPVTANLTGLSANTAYHFRVVATNSAGTTNGADQTFTTGAAPVVVTQAATLVTSTGAQLNGTVNPGRLATTYHFEYGTTTGYGSQSPAVDASAGSGSAAVAESATLTGLTAGTTYHYRLVATNSAGTVQGADQQFVTPLPPAPPDVTTGAASSVLDTTATVSGTVNPNGTSTTYHVEYGTTTSYGSQSGDTSAGSGSSAQPASANLTGLTPGTQYHYRLVATNSAGTANGADQTFTTGVRPAVTTQAATGVGASGATLNGSVNPNGDTTTYHFEYGTTTGYGSQSASANAGAGSSSVAESLALSGLANGTTYHFRLVAANSAGTTFGPDQQFTTLPPPVATTDAASSILDTSATLGGTVDPNGSVSSYRFEYGTATSYGSQSPAVDASAGSGSAPVTVSADLTGLAPATTYYFRVVATSPAGTSYGDQGSFTTGSAPVVVTQDATTMTTSAATLNGTVNPGRLATTYRFEYGTTLGYGSQSTSASAGSGTSPVLESLTLTGLAADTTYHFRIVATNAAGTTTGDDATFTTPARPVDPPAQTTPPATATTQSPADTEPATTPPVINTAPAPCKPAFRIARHRRMALLTIRCAPSGKLTAIVVRGKHRLVRARRAHKGTGDVKLRLRIPRRAFGHAKSLRLTVKVTVAGATGAPQVLRRRVTIRT
jgi:phosphodiesterase/alkaline phosphatase D-like protein